MGKFKVTKTHIKDLIVIEPEIIGDNRGSFMEIYNKKDLYQIGIYDEFVQENQSFSVKGVLRGLHFQKNYPQSKLARVLSGRVFDVAVDLRKNSNTFGEWYGVELSDKNNKLFYIPQGFAHGLIVLSETAVFCYKCNQFYHPNDEDGIMFDDPEINIMWPEVKKENSNYFLEDGTKLIISEKDKKWNSFKDINI